MFDSIQVENEQEAYLLGFLYADGSINTFVSGKYRALTIALQEKDQSFLQNICDIFNQELNKTYTLKYKAVSKSYHLYIGDGQTIENLIRLGITPRKSYENSSFVFENVPLELKNHFIRGYFDGDGSVGLYKRGENKTPSLTGNIVSLNESILFSIQKFLKEQDIRTILRKDNKYSRLQFAGNRVREKFRNFLYKDATLFMERKKNVFFSQDPLPTKKYTGITKRRNKFFVVINYDNKHHSVGFFNTVLEAISAYNAEAIIHNKQIQEYKGESLI